MAKPKPQKKECNCRGAGLFIPAGLLVGMGIGFLTNFIAGLFIGLGAGFVVAAVVKLLCKCKRQ